MTLFDAPSANPEPPTTNVEALAWKMHRQAVAVDPDACAYARNIQQLVCHDLPPYLYRQLDPGWVRRLLPKLTPELMIRAAARTLREAMEETEDDTSA